MLLKLCVEPALLDISLRKYGVGTPVETCVARTVLEAWHAGFMCAACVFGGVSESCKCASEFMFESCVVTGALHGLFEVYLNRCLFETCIWESCLKSVLLEPCLSHV